jgi:signal transduction histidine kinase
MPVNVSRFALGDLVTELLTGLEPIIVRSGLTVAAEVPRELAPIDSDRQKVKQILLNLVSNAIKFTRQGWVRISVLQPDGRTAITVTDSGVGIAPEHHDRVFDPFWQADGSPSRTQGGTGLGLPICRKLAGLLGGEVTLASAVGEGAAFTLQLPR